MLKLLLLLLISFNVFATTNEIIHEVDLKNKSLDNKATTINYKHSADIHEYSVNPVSHLTKIGSGKMHFLFWHLYNAEFYAKNDIFQNDIYPQALKLTYQRDIKKADFIDATKDQWDKLKKLDEYINVPDELQILWIAKLNTIFTNIKTNDTILLVINESKESQFFLKKNNAEKNEPNINYKKIGMINQPEFGPYFLSIWLSKYTSEPKLRKKLIGENR